MESFYSHNRDYHKYTDYDKEPCAILRLDRIVDCLKSHYCSANDSKVKILEIGCGTGNICRAVASLGYQVTGIDIDQQSIEAAASWSPFDNVSYMTQNIYELTGSFDTVICSEVIEHFEKPRDLLRQIHNLLKPEGLLLATIPNGFGPEELVRRFLTTTDFGGRILRILKRTVLTHDVVQTQNFHSPHLHYFSLRRFTTLLKQAGFDVIDISNWTVFFLQSYYLFLRLFIQRGSAVFLKLDSWDRYLAEHWPLHLSGGWFFAVKKGAEINE